VEYARQPHEWRVRADGVKVGIVTDDTPAAELLPRGRKYPAK
jgi:hypothetical protein